MSSSLRRLAKDHASLRRSLPPNYLFPESDSITSSDDLTQLLILVTGADGTPYSQGLWQLHLKMPIDYPKNPPKATFKTRIYHPNVDEQSGAVCLETLKRDWDPKLTLKDILVTISCLLIQPNPDSALNAAAGALIQEDYDSFSRQARLMTSIHAPIPKHLHTVVQEARRRGEETSDANDIKRDSQSTQTRIIQRTDLQSHDERPERQLKIDESKENNMSHPTVVVRQPILNSQNIVLGKRPIFEMSSIHTYDTADREIRSSIATEALKLNGTRPLSEDHSRQPARKSPKYIHMNSSIPDMSKDLTCPNNITNVCKPLQLSVDNEKENEPDQGCSRLPHKETHMQAYTKAAEETTKQPVLRKVSTSALSKTKMQPRIGIRRL